MSCFLQNFEYKEQKNIINKIMTNFNSESWEDLRGLSWVLIDDEWKTTLLWGGKVLKRIRVH